MIKFVRETTSLGLKESKDKVDDYLFFSTLSVDFQVHINATVNLAKENNIARVYILRKLDGIDYRLPGSTNWEK